MKIIRDKYIDGLYTVLTVSLNGKTVPGRYKTADWASGYNAKFSCTRATYENRLYQGLTNVLLDDGSSQSEPEMEN